MSFERLPKGMHPTQVLDAAFAHNSPYVPHALLLLINQGTGKLAFIRGFDRKCLVAPEGSIHRPISYNHETAHNKVIDTVRARTNATLGHLARVQTLKVQLMPYVNTFSAIPQGPEAERWPNAIGKALMPVVVPVEVNGPDPKAAHEVVWACPEEAVGVLQQSIANNPMDPIRTRTTIDAVRLALPTLRSLA